MMLIHTIAWNRRPGVQKPHAATDVKPAVSAAAVNSVWLVADVPGSVSEGLDVFFYHKSHILFWIVCITPHISSVLPGIQSTTQFSLDSVTWR